MIHHDVHQQEEDMRKGVGEGRGSGEVSGEGRIGCTLTKFIALLCPGLYVLSILAEDSEQISRSRTNLGRGERVD